MPWIVTLPSISAANLERKHALTPAAMDDVIAYARGEYAQDLLKGRSDPQAIARIVKRVTELTGLDEDSCAAPAAVSKPGPTCARSRANEASSAASTIPT